MSYAVIEYYVVENRRAHPAGEWYKHDEVGPLNIHRAMEIRDESNLSIKTNDCKFTVEAKG